MGVLIQRASHGVAEVIIDNPNKKGALSYEMFQQLASMWDVLAADSSVRAVLLTGSIDGHFCSGADLSANLHEIPGIDRLIERALLKSSLFDKPIVAAVNGHCVAGGLELVLSSDVRIAWDDAKFGLPEVRWGIVPSGGAAIKLVDQVGHANAMSLLLSGRMISGVEARRIGLVNEAVPLNEVSAVARQYVNDIIVGSPLAMAATKRLAMMDRLRRYRNLRFVEMDLVNSVRASGHVNIGIKAFIDRKIPVYP